MSSPKKVPPQAKSLQANKPQNPPPTEKPAPAQSAKPALPVTNAPPVPPLLMPGALSRELIRVMLLGFGIYGFYKFSHQVVPILLMFAMVFLLAIILNSVVSALEKRGVRRGIGVALILLTLLGSVVLAGSLIVPPALEQANTLVAKAPQYWSTIRERAQELEKRYPALHNVLPQLESGNAATDSADASGEKTPADADSEPKNGNSATPSTENASETPKSGLPFDSLLRRDALMGYARQALAITSGLVGGVFVTVLSLLLLLFTLGNPQALVGGFLSAVPADHREAARRSMARIFKQMPGWARATVINGTITGVLTGVGLALVGVQPALVLGICAFFGEFVPNVGPLVMAAPALFVALSISPAKALAALGVIVFVQAVASNALNPIIMGREMKLHPVTITFFALSMGALFGVAGAILAVPAAATAKILFEEFYVFPCQVPVAEIEKQAADIVSGNANVEEPDD